jgi:DNA gyrase subunit A
MSALAVEILQDIEKETVDFISNYDGTRQEPTVLPAKFPNLLCNGASGIAVGMATSIPPHNLNEVADALSLLVDDPEATVDEITEVLPGPDFPTYGLIIGAKGIQNAYRTGRGTITVRGRAVIEPLQGGKNAVLITELPYQVNKSSLIENIAALVRQRKLEGIANIVDETDKTGMKIVVELKREATPLRVLNYLYKHTALQSTFGIIMLGLLQGVPRTLNIKQALQSYIDHRKIVITRRTRFELEQAKQRAHILEGFRIALDNLDEVIAIIRGSQAVPEARDALMERFGLTRVQCQAVLELTLQRLTRLERQKIDDEHTELLKSIAQLEDILADIRRVLQIIKQELSELKRKYGDERRTKIIAKEAEDISDEDLIEQEDMAVTVTRDGYVKRMPLEIYHVQGRGGRGIVALTKKEEDAVERLFVTTTHHVLLFFTTKGKVYHLKAYEVPVGSRQARGTAIINLVQTESGEKVTAVMSVKDFRKGFVFMATRKGVVKRCRLKEFDTPLRTKGIIAISLSDDDELHWVKQTSGKDQVVLVTSAGMAIRFKEDGVRAMGRQAAGVIGARLGERDEVVGLAVPAKGEEILVASEKGSGKRTPVEDYRLTARGAQGVKTLRVNEKTGSVVGACAVTDQDEVMLMTAKGILIRVPVGKISSQGRITSGVRLIRLEEKDEVRSLAKVVKQGEE